MLRRTTTKHDSNPLKLLIPFLYAPLSTKPRRSTTQPKPTSLAVRNPQASGDTVSPSHVNSICSLLACPTRKASTVDDLLMPFAANLSSTVVLGVLMGYRQFGRVRTLEFFSWAGSQMGFRFDDSVIEYMADFLGRRKLFDDMKCFLLTVTSHRHQVSCRTLSICIRYLGRQGKVSEALSLFEETGSKFLSKPDNLVYNNMLYVLCKKSSSEHSIDLALQILRTIESPDTFSYSNVIVGLCKFDRLETALRVFGEMGRAGLVPTRSAVNVLIGKLCSLSSKEGAVEKVRVRNTRRPFTILVPNVSEVKSGAIEPAVKVFRAVHGLGLLPSSFVVVQLLGELCRVGKTDEAVEVLRVIERAKLSCRDESYSVVMAALCEHRRVEQASRLFRRMISSGTKPKLSVYNSVISMLSKVGNFDDATRVFEIMNKNRCVANGSTYSMLICGCVEARKWETAYDLLMEMIGLGWDPDFQTYGTVVEGLSRAGKTGLCVKLETRLESQALQKLCKAGQVEDAYEKLKVMLDKGLYPGRYVRDSFERAFEKAGKSEMARELLGEVDKAESLKRKRNTSLQVTKKDSLIS